MMGKTHKNNENEKVLQETNAAFIDAKNKLEEQQSLLSVVIENLPVGVIIAEVPSGKIVLGNIAMETIWRMPLLRTQFLDEYINFKRFHLDGRRYLISELSLIRAIAGGEIVIEAEEIIERGDGSRGIIQTNAAPIKNANGTVIAAVSTNIDISARKQTEERLKRLSDTFEQQVFERTAQIQVTNQELGSVIYSMSHDLYSPLRGISGFIGFLSEKLEKKQVDAETRSYTDRIQGIVNRMEHMVGAIHFLLDIFRTDYKQQEIKLSEMVAEIAADFKNKSPQRTGEFIIEPHLVCCADKEAIRELLNNMLSNAWKYTTHKPYRIEFGKIVKDGQPVYFIKDNGIGFDNKNATQIFRPFSQLGGYPTGETGYGIGLAIAHAIIKKHLGDLWADGEEGKGATFYFTLGGRET